MPKEAEVFIGALPPPQQVTKAELFAALCYFYTDRPDVITTLGQDLDRVEQANVAVHKQTRHSGDAAITHELYMAIQLANLGFPLDMVRTALYHDCVEDTNMTLEEVALAAGTPVARMVDAITKVKSENVQAAQQLAPNKINLDDLTIEKVLEAFTADHRSIYIKGVDNAHNALTYSSLPPEKRPKKANISLEVYNPLMEGFGLQVIAHDISTGALLAARPNDYARIIQLQESVITPQMMTYLHEIAYTWTEQIFEGNPLEYEAVRVTAPAPYEIYQQKTKGTEYIRSDLLPSITIVTPTRSLRRRWYAYLSSRYQFTPEEARSNPFLQLNENIAVTKMVPLQVANLLDNYRVILTTSEIETAPMHLDLEHIDLTEGQRSHAQQMLENLILRYKKAVAGKDEDAVIREDIIETAKRGAIAIITPKGETISMPRGSTVLDAAYIIGKNLGNAAIGAEITRGDRRDELKLDDLVASGDHLIIKKNPGVHILPQRFDLVTTYKALTDIQQSLERYSPEVKQAAQKRAKEILLWLYKEKTGQDLDIHLSHGFETETDDLLAKYYGSQEVFLENLGLTPIPAQKDEYFVHWDENTRESQLSKLYQPQIRHALRFVDHLVSYRQACATLRITITDQKGVLSTVGTILEFMGISALPIKGYPDHANTAEDAAVLEIVFHEADAPEAFDMIPLLTDLYKDQITIALFPGKKERKSTKQYEK